MDSGINIELINACALGDRNAQRRLYAMLMPYLNMVCRRYLFNASETQDVLQETFVSIFSNLHQYDAGRSAFKTWATRITINFCLKNNAKRKQTATDEFLINLHDTPVAPEVLKNLSNDELLDLLKTMPESFFQVFNLYVIDGFSHEEIAEILGIEAALSRQRLSRGREWLRKKCAPGYLYALNLMLN